MKRFGNIMKVNFHTDQPHPRKRILDASIKLFAELGYERTSIDLICKEAKVNRAMVSYYYGGKLTLFREIIENSTYEFLRKLREKVYNEKSAKQRLRVFIKLYIERNFQETLVTEIIVREVGSNLANSSDFLTPHFLQVIAVLTDVIQEGTETGTFNNTIAPIVMASYVFSALNSYFVLHRLIQQAGSAPLIDPDHRNLIAEQLYKLILKGISAK